MIKCTNCRELNWFDHDEILNKVDNILLNRFMRKLKGTTVKLSSKYDYCIIHKSTKKDCYQISYFDNTGAYADKEVENFKEAVKTVFKKYKTIN